VDTNVIAELRKGTRANRHVRSWFEAVDPDAVLLSVLTLGEIRRGVENVRRRDPASARALERWRRRLVLEHGERMLPVDLAVAEQWALLNVPDPIPVIDGLLAATAKVHDLTFVTRNVKDVARTGVRLMNPFDHAPSREPLP
jgi:predicted nucleic acid-binding protein